MAAKKKAATKKPARGGKRKVKETKAETVEVETGVQLLLGNMPPDRDAEKAYETLAHLMAKAATAGGHVSEQKRKMKDQGMDVKAFVDTMRLERMDPLDVAAEFKERARLMRLRGMPVQVSLFEPKYANVELQARAEGYAAGKAGRSMDGARWQEGMPGFTDYQGGWSDGQREIILGEKPADDES